MVTQTASHATLRSLLWFLQKNLSPRENTLLPPLKFFNPETSLSDVLALLPLQQMRKNQLHEAFGQHVQKEWDLENILTRSEIEEMIGNVLPDIFPLALRYQGNPAILRKPKVAIIGSRHATYYGRQQGHLFAKVLAEAGCCIVSGGAIGIDSIANSRALDSGASCAVIGSGVNKLYPASNIPLFLDLSRSSNGLLLSEFPDDLPPGKWNFPRRNQTIAALADFVLVIEAHVTSGSLITANAALDFGIDLGAVPGPVDSMTSSGTNALLKAGAYVIETPSDVLERLASQVRLRKLNIDRSRLSAKKVHFQVEQKNAAL